MESAAGAVSSILSVCGMSGAFVVGVVGCVVSVVVKDEFGGGRRCVGDVRRAYVSNNGGISDLARARSPAESIYYLCLTIIPPCARTAPRIQPCAPTNVPAFVLGA